MGGVVNGIKYLCSIGSVSQHQQEHQQGLVLGGVSEYHGSAQGGSDRAEVVASEAVVVLNAILRSSFPLPLSSRPLRCGRAGEEGVEVRRGFDFYL